MATGSDRRTGVVVQTAGRTAPLRLGILLMAMLAGVMLPGAASAQSGLAADDPLPGSPLELLLQQRDALNLTTDQLAGLGEIRDRLASENEPLVNQMMTLRTEWQQARRAVRNGRPKAAARVERIRLAAEQARTRIQQNNRMAMQRVNRLLRPAQRAQLRAIVQERRQQKPGRRAGSGSNAGDSD